MSSIILSQIRFYQVQFMINLFQKGAEVYCITCSAIICALCYLDLHHKHNYKILEKLVKKIKINLNKTLCELKYGHYNYSTFYF